VTVRREPVLVPWMIRWPLTSASVSEISSVPRSRLTRLNSETSELGAPRPCVRSHVDQGVVPLVDRVREQLYLMGVEEPHLLSAIVARELDREARGSCDDAVDLQHPHDA